MRRHGLGSGRRKAVEVPDVLEKAWAAAWKEKLTPGRVLALLVRGKFEERGIELTSTQLRSIECQLEEGPPYHFALELGPEAEAKMGQLDIDVQEQDLTRFLDDIARQLSEEFPGILEKCADAILAQLQRDAKRMLREHRRIRAGFCARLRRVWARPIGYLEMLKVSALEAGEEFNAECEEVAGRESDFVFDALRRLHARACQVADEVLVLLRNGLADGADARWRTMHEIAVVGWVIQSEGNEVAERFLLHQVVEEYKTALSYQQHCEALHQEPLTPEELGRLKDDHDALVRRFGQDYGEQYGWAAAALAKHRPTFCDLEERAELAHLRPFYKVASQNVHAGSRGTLYRLGLDPSNVHLLLAGPSNAGLAEPGQSAAVSLNQITAALLLTKPNLDRLLICTVLGRLTEKTLAAFAEAQELYQRLSPEGG